MKDSSTQIIEFINDTQIEKCDRELQAQVKKCFLDLVLVLICGTRNESSKTFASYAEKHYKGDEATILCSGKKASIIGAALANAASANALGIADYFGPLVPCMRTIA